MADVYAIFGTLLALGIAFPGMLTTSWLLFPARVEVARQRLESTPWRTLGMGIFAAFLVGLPAVILLALPAGPAKFLGATLIIAALTVSSLGAAGIASQMAAHLRAQSAGIITGLSGFVRAAVALELAAAFPVIGWFIFIPLTLIISLGAATFALLGWQPARGMAQAPADTLTSQA